MPEKNETLESFNLRKQEIYIKADLFLQIANSEGYSYASNDALINGLVTIATNVGGFAGDVDKNCYVELDWKKCYGDNIDYEYLCNKIRYAWENKEELSKKGREWYMKYCRFDDWEYKMRKIIDDFYNFNYSDLSDISSIIVNEVRGINRVVYDITSKPPGTIEWE